MMRAASGTHSLLSSLNMLIETQSGSEYSDQECKDLMTEAGFHEIRLEPAGPLHSAAIAIK